jgi:hypothetical protein
MTIPVRTYFGLSADTNGGDVSQPGVDRTGFKRHDDRIRFVWKEHRVYMGIPPTSLCYAINCAWIHRNTSGRSMLCFMNYKDDRLGKGIAMEQGDWNRASLLIHERQLKRIMAGPEIALAIHWNAVLYTPLLLAAGHGLGPHRRK